MSVHFFVIASDFWYASVFVDNGNTSFAGVMQPFLGVLYAGMDAGQALADLGNITKASGAGHDMFALMDRKSLVRTMRGPRQMCGHTTPCNATRSAAPPSRGSKSPAKQAGGSTVANVPFSTEVYTQFCDGSRSTVVPYSCQGLVLQITNSSLGPV